MSVTLRTLSYTRLLQFILTLFYHGTHTLLPYSHSSTTQSVTDVVFTNHNACNPKDPFLPPSLQAAAIQTQVRSASHAAHTAGILFRVVSEVKAMTDRGTEQ